MTQSTKRLEAEIAQLPAQGISAQANDDTVVKTISPLPIAAPLTEGLAAEVETAPDAAQPPSPPAPPVKSGSDEPEPNKKRKFPKVDGKKVLSAAFNMAAGAGATYVTKAAVVAMMLSASPVAVVLASAVAVAVVGTGVRHLLAQRAAKKSGAQRPKFLSKKNAEGAAFSFIFSALGGSLFLAFEDQIKAGVEVAKHWASAQLASLNFPAITWPGAPVPTAPAANIPVVVAPPPCSALQAMTDIAASHSVSPAVEDALRRAGSENARIAAQGLKDLAYYTTYGFGGVPQNAALSLELAQRAAEGGNIQAREFLLFKQFHGLDGIVANRADALSGMEQISRSSARSLASAWSAIATPTNPPVSFNAAAIVSGAPRFCPAS